jgi:hypothetical protein
MRRAPPAASAVVVMLSALLAAPPAARAVAFLQGVTQSCFTSADCETAPAVFGAGNPAQLSRSYGTSEGFSYATSATVTLEYVGFAAFARASGFESPNPPPIPPILTGNQNYSGRSFGNLFDTVTAGAGGGPGFLRLPLHVVGTSSISWQNGFGNVQLGISCTSNEVGSFVPLGPCTGAGFTFTGNEALDTIVDVDVPILLGVPVELRVSAVLTAATGHPLGSAIPFAGASEASFATLPFTGATVLDASRDPIPGASVSAESGFSYVPEPGAAAAELAALAALAFRTRSSRPRRTAASRIGGMRSQRDVTRTPASPSRRRAARAGACRGRRTRSRRG